MYAALWRLLPGPFVVRLVLALALVALAAYLCLEYLFPVVADRLPINDGTVST